MLWLALSLAVMLAAVATGYWLSVTQLLEQAEQAAARERGRADKLEAMLDEIRARELRVELPATVAARPTPVPLPPAVSQYLAGFEDPEEREVLATLARTREAEGHAWDVIIPELMGN